MRRTATWSLTCLALAVTTLVGAATVAQEAAGKGRYILATGRRLPYIYVLSLDAALDPANDGTSRAIIGRSKVATEALDGRSVIDLGRALRGDARAEVGRIPTQVGPWGITATPDRRHIIVANGGSQRDGSAGNTISMIDVDRASAGAARAEVARVLVGTGDPSEHSHPLPPSRPTAGKWSSRTCARTTCRSWTSSGRSPANVIDLRSRRVVATVTGVGHEPYALAVVER